MVDPKPSKLTGTVEVDETVIPFYPKSAKEEVQEVPVVGSQGRSHKGKIAVMGAVEFIGKKPGRIRLEVIADYSPDSFKEFIVSNIALDSLLATDGFTSYAGILGYDHKPTMMGKRPAHEVLPWIHRVFANLKRWGLGVYHGLRKKYLDAYLNEFVFRWNRRRSYRSAFERLMGIGLAFAPATGANIRVPAVQPF